MKTFTIFIAALALWFACAEAQETFEDATVAKPFPVISPRPIRPCPFKCHITNCTTAKVDCSKPPRAVEESPQLIEEKPAPVEDFPVFYPRCPCVEYCLPTKTYCPTSYDLCCPQPDCISVCELVCPKIKCPAGCTGGIFYEPINPENLDPNQKICDYGSAKQCECKSCGRCPTGPVLEPSPEISEE